MQSVLARKLSEEWKHFRKQPTFWISFSGYFLVLIISFLLASILNLYRKLVVAFTSYSCCQISQYRMSKNNLWNMYCRKYMARNYFADRWSDLWSEKKFHRFWNQGFTRQIKFQFLNQANYSTQYCFGTPYSALASPCDAFTITIVL